MLPRSSRSKPARTGRPRAREAQSFLSQAESTGEIVGGFALAALAQASGISMMLLTSAALIAATGALGGRSRPSGPPG